MPTILPPPSPVIAVLSQKGGTGKTTLVRTLTDVLRRAGLDVLAVDLDPQGNLSDYFDVDPDAHPTIGEVLSGRARATDAVHKQMIPANLGLAEAELVLSGKMGRELTLKRALHESRRQFDLILIDCPPALGLLTVNALVASTHSLVSAEGEYFSLQGVEQVLEVMQLARENLNEGLDWLGVVMNIADLRTIHSRDALKSLRESYDDRVFETVIRRSIRYPESAERGVSILDYSPELGKDYLVLADELLARLGDEETRRRVGVLREELVPAPTGPAETHPEAADDVEPPTAPATPAAPTGW
jgi:chromosome partitioning protein